MRNLRRHILSLVLPLCLVAGAAQADLSSLDDEALARETGAGVALAFDQFEFAMAPTSYFEQVGSAPGSGLACTATGQSSGNYNCWRRGDLRWYGLNISGAGNTGYHWNDSASCSAGSLNCPRGGLIAWFSPYDNPYLMRAASPTGMGYAGTCINGAVGGCGGTPASKAIYEFLAPTALNGAGTGPGQPNYTVSWWGEIESGATRNSATAPLTTGIGGAVSSNGGGLIRSQNIIRGNAAGSVFRLFQFTEPGNQTFGMYYHSRLRGDFRFSVAQVAPNAVDAAWDRNHIGQPTVFADTEGMFFRGVDAFIPFGQLYYQALTVRPVGTGGNFEISLTPLPAATATVYNHHYALNSGDTLGYETARLNNTGGALTNPNYAQTHGFSRWGGWSATGNWLGRNLINGNDGGSTGDGVIFQACTGCGHFLAYAARPMTIDKRGPSASMHKVQNYNCLSGNAGGCATGEGPIAAGAGDPGRTYPTAVVNLGDSRIEGLMFQSFRFESCGGSATC